MAVHTYECMFIFDPNRFAKDAAILGANVGEMVQKRGGEVLASRLWEERKLAYPIDGNKRGAYWLMYFKLDGDQIAPLQRDCQLDDSILRQLVLKIDPRIADHLVRLAQGEVTEEEPEAAGSEA
ncbi:MAG: 30S ribosomal protein S6 [Pirellulales bacterium]|nr:30S ribosomal protein S6 [Pirellulales bacterium]